MNRFLTHTGRQPIWLDDLNFIQDSFADEIKKLVQGLVGMDEEAVILTGCNMTLSNGVTSVSEGIIYLRGELLRVLPASVKIVFGADLIFESSQIMDDAGDRILLDSGTQVSCYSLHNANIVAKRILPDSDAIKVLTCPRLDDLLKARYGEVILAEGVYEHNNNDYERSSVQYTLYRHSDSYYLNFAYSGTPVPVNFSFVVDKYNENDLKALGYVNTGDTTAPYWQRCETTYGTTTIRYNKEQMDCNQDVTPVSVMVKTRYEYAIADKKNYLRCHFSLYSGISEEPNDKLCSCGGTIKLNTI